MPDAPYHPGIPELVRQSYENSRDHGFWDNPQTDETLPSKLMLIVSEAAEALESYRDPESDSLIKVPVSIVERLVVAPSLGDDDAVEALGELAAIHQKWLSKPKGFDIEIADILIRCFDLAGRLGIDLEGAVQRKMDYNTSRPPLHGKRV